MIGFRPKSPLAFIITVSLVVYYYGISTGNQNLQAASETVLILSAIPFCSFCDSGYCKKYREFDSVAFPHGSSVRRISVGTFIMTVRLKTPSKVLLGLPRL